MLAASVREEILNQLLDDGKFAVHDFKEPYADFVDKFGAMLTRGFDNLYAHLLHDSFYQAHWSEINYNEVQTLVAHLKKNRQLKELFNDGLAQFDFDRFTINFRNKVYTAPHYNDWFSFLLHANKALGAHARPELGGIASDIAGDARSSVEDVEMLLEWFGTSIAKGTQSNLCALLDDKRVFKKKTFMGFGNDRYARSIELSNNWRKATFFERENSIVTWYMLLYKGMEQFVTNKMSSFDKKRKAIPLDALSKEDKLFVKQYLVALENVA